ncbi:hypothetical protein [Brachybacterium hainanense]|uniref:ABC transporter permease n=1 Tax=Brachybacterium hainanense TaxID=1541174 RepID=A0ABV6RD17_9MICO
MSALALARSEASKLLTMPSTGVLAAVTILGTWPQAWSNAAAYTLSADDPRLFGEPVPPEFHGFSMAGFGYVFIVVLGALWAAGEYGGARQIQATLTATPRRAPVFAVKAAWLAVTTAVISFLSMGGAIMITHAAAGDGIHPFLLTGRIWGLIGGLVASWTLTALIAFALGSLARSAVVPMLVLMPLVVGLGSFLAGIWAPAMHLPVVAGSALYSPPDSTGVLDPLAGGLVQLAWAAVLLVVAGTAFIRRDA